MDIDAVAAVARAAGELALRMQATIRAEFKSDQSYVTEVDRTVELYLKEELQRLRPGTGFVGEEFGGADADRREVWAVDPIDGTTNMVFGVPLWCISIGLVDDKGAAAGVVHMPLTGDMFTGVRGRGAHRNGKPMHASDRESPHAEDTLGFTSGSLKRFDTSGVAGRLRCLGSIATDLALTAAGSLCSLVAVREGACDIAAGLCLVAEAGCRAAYMDGDPLEIGVVMREGRTARPFVIAPPMMDAYLRRTLVERT